MRACTRMRAHQSEWVYLNARKIAIRRTRDREHMRERGRAKSPSDTAKAFMREHCWSGESRRDLRGRERSRGCFELAKANFLCLSC
eukprot:3401069-Pleurochrysis_carterae.AAC.1